MWSGYSSTPLHHLREWGGKRLPAAATTTAMDEPESESEPTTISAPVREETVPRIILEPEPEDTSDQVCELATSSVPEGILMEFEGTKWSPIPSTVAEEDLLILLMDWEWVYPACLVTLHWTCHITQHELLESVFPPCLPIPPPLSVSSQPIEKYLPVLCRSRVLFLRDLSASWPSCWIFRPGSSHILHLGPACAVFYVPMYCPLDFVIIEAWEQASLILIERIEMNFLCVWVHLKEVFHMFSGNIVMHGWIHVLPHHIINRLHDFQHLLKDRNHIHRQIFLNWSF